MTRNYVGTKTTTSIHFVLNSKANFADKQQHIYVPHIEADAKRDEMCFFELKSMDQYNNEMNVANRFGLRQFNEPAKLSRVDVGLFDLVVVPGLVFELAKPVGFF